VIPVGRVAMTHDTVRVGIVLDVEDSPVTLSIWARLVAAALVEELDDHGVIASLIRIDIDDRSDLVS
jgi:hypothetical protein